ncbi:MAG TPA: hypothetical protein VGY53_03775, partial [Isosphaeraceae bacterium]|nr:hypothetical protein [Isosphaeraceae bacterium]
MTSDVVPGAAEPGGKLPGTPVEGAVEAPLLIASPESSDGWSGQWIAQATAGFVVLGLLLRVVRYLS